MGWEERGGRRYYYEKVRDGGRVVSRYVGAGEHAELLAGLSELYRQRRENDQFDELAARAKVEQFDAELAGLGALLSALTGAVMVANNYHQHSGQWRRQRGRRQEQEDANGA